MDRITLKNQAKEQIKGKIGILFVISLIIGLIEGVIGLLNFLPGVGIVVTIIVTPAFALSLSRIYLGLTASITPTVGDAFSGFNDFWSSFKVTFLTGLLCFLWSLLLIVPGIIKAYSYSMAPYILAENKGMSARECLRRSKEMTNGHKMDLFVLRLSFIGWALLCAVTLGIASIWVIPYVQTTMANAYNSLKRGEM